MSVILRRRSLTPQAPVKAREASIQWSVLSTSALNMSATSERGDGSAGVQGSDRGRAHMAMRPNWETRSVC